jgi:ABC-type sugar transport system permease subunit
MSIDTSATAARQAGVRQGFTNRKKASLMPYLYVSPAMIVIVLIFGYPVYLNVRYSLMELTGFDGVFSGLRNYRILFEDQAFYQSLLHNVMLLALVPVLVFLCIVFATLLFERVRGWRIYRTVIFLPTVLSITVIGITFSVIFQGNGALNEMLRGVGLRVIALDWLGGSGLALVTVMFVILWREMGFGTILFLARLASISEEMFDAARLDGAGWWARLWYIIIPELAIIIEFYSVIMVITMLSWVFNYVFVMTSGGPGYSTYVTELYIYNEAFKHNRLGVAAAAAVVLLLITVALMLVSLRQRRKVVEAYA